MLVITIENCSAFCHNSFKMKISPTRSALEIRIASNIQVCTFRIYSVLFWATWSNWSMIWAQKKQMEANKISAAFGSELKIWMKNCMAKPCQQTLWFIRNCNSIEIGIKIYSFEAFRILFDLESRHWNCCYSKRNNKLENRPICTKETSDECF